MYNDRTQVDQQGYLLPMLIDLSDDNSESGYLSPICLSQATNATSPALPARNQQPSSQLTAINLNDLDPLFNSERAVATQSDCGYVEAVERQSSDNLYEESYVNLFASKEHTYSEVSSPGKSTWQFLNI